MYFYSFTFLSKNQIKWKMKLFLIPILSSVYIFSFTQSTFKKKAYYIDNNGLFTECLIKDMDWVNNPVNFEYKLSANDAPKTMDISSVKEFGIVNISRFIRADVKIDRSKTKLKDLSQDKEPEWSKEQLFLKVLIKGKASLYYFQDSNHIRFFYSIDNSPIEQLVYKEYYLNGQRTFNAYFRQQLSVNIRCKSLSDKYILTMPYRQVEIVHYFKIYYEDINDQNVEYDKSLNRFFQITFDKAYYFDNNGLKTDCLIKNQVWVNNPTNFEFKFSTDDTPKTMDISSVKEFGIYNISRYVRADIKIDRSKTKMKELTQEKEPAWSNELLFLKVLIEGKATLYYFQDFYNTRFFYSIDNSPIAQLIYREYFSADGKLKANGKFRQQLWAYLRCNCITERYVEKMEYSQTDIEDYFKKYYECTKDPCLVF
jgi:hypothetical protein